VWGRITRGGRLGGVGGVRSGGEGLGQVGRGEFWWRRVTVEEMGRADVCGGGGWGGYEG
jgi:hypothetical protein